MVDTYRARYRTVIKLIYLPGSVTNYAFMSSIMENTSRAIQEFIESDRCDILEIDDNLPYSRLMMLYYLIAEERYVTVTQVTAPTSTKRDNVMTSYFASKQDPQRRHNWIKNGYGVMEEWHNSLTRHGIAGVVFHDHLTATFIKEHGDSLRYEQVKLGQRTINDERYIHYLDYLERHTELEYVLMTDISDVLLVGRNVFEAMRELDSSKGFRHIFIGQDIALIPNIGLFPFLKDKMKICFGKDYNTNGGTKSLNIYSIILNAGVIGGSRSVVLRFLRLVSAVLRSLSSDKNCNMATVNYVMHRHFADVIFTGHPLTSSFWKNGILEDDVFIKHK